MTKEELWVAYLNITTEFEAAKEDQRKIAIKLQTIARELEARPQETCFINIEGEEEPSLDTIMVWVHKTFDAATFPTAAELQAAVRRVVVAKLQAQQLWQKLDEHQRSHLKECR